MAETREDKIKFLKSQLTLVSVSLSNAAAKIKAGQTVRAGDILDLTNSQKNLQDEIRKLEEPEAPEAPSPTPPIEGGATTSTAAPAPEPDPEEGAEPDPE